MFFHVHAGRIQVILRHSPPGLDEHPQPEGQSQGSAGHENLGPVRPDRVQLLSDLSHEIHLLRKF